MSGILICPASVWCCYVTVDSSGAVWESGTLQGSQDLQEWQANGIWLGITNFSLWISIKEDHLLRECTQLNENVRILLNENRRLLVEQAGHKCPVGKKRGSLRRPARTSVSQVPRNSRQDDVYQRQIALMSKHKHRQSNVIVHQLLQALTYVSSKCLFM